MGFDLYGLNPKLKSKEPSINWEDKPSDKEKRQYFKDREKFLKENVGHYFRNNVWWWRPLADYVLNLMGGIIPKEDHSAWHHNDGYRVEEDIALKIADRLEQELKTSRVRQIQKHYDEVNKKAIEHNNKLRIKMKELHQIVIDKTGDENIAPVSYPEPFKSQWDDIYKMLDHMAGYPFSEENVVDFMRFCRASGGFKIC